MAAHRPVLPALALALALGFGIGACATTPSPQLPAPTAISPGVGFTNSALRTALYQWPCDDPALKSVCLRNSLAIFAFLQECGDGAARETAEGLHFGTCTRSAGGRSGSFRVHTTAAEAWNVGISFREAEQLFVVSATATREAPASDPSGQGSAAPRTKR